MSYVQKPRDDARPHPEFHNGRVIPALKSINNWHWHDPPILFPICLSLLILGYAALRTPQ
jgi:hypothetical protein